MLLLKKTLQFSPAALASVMIVLIPLNQEFWVKPVILIGILIWGLYQREIYLDEGKLRKRKRFELAFCTILFLLSLNDISATFQFWPVLPAFLYFVWVGFSITELFLLTLIFSGLSNFWFQVSPGIQQYLMLVLGVLCAVLFRHLERNKKLQLQKRLETFETFEKRISSGSIGLDEVTQLQVKKLQKLAS
jgi:hypothetical protein